MATTTTTPLDAAAIRAEFPIFEQRFRGKELVYLDSAASAQKPRHMLDAMHECVTMRGDQQSDSSTVTIAARGEFTEPAARAEIIALLTAHGGRE